MMWFSMTVDGFRSRDVVESVPADPIDHAGEGESPAKASIGHHRRESG